MRIKINIEGLNYGSAISPQYKNSICCQSYNNSPAISWSLEGILDKWIESFSLFVYCDELGTERNYPETNGNFCHWGVRGIPVTCQEIKKNGKLPGGVDILKTDFNSGDKYNGWNGPGYCNVNRKTKLYAKVIAIIKDDDFCLRNVFGENIPEDRAFESQEFIFFDNPGVVEYTANECNKSICPHGSEEIDGKCYANDNEVERIIIPCYYTIVNNESDTILNVVTEKVLFTGSCYTFKLENINDPYFTDLNTGEPIKFNVLSQHINKQIPNDAINVDEYIITLEKDCNNINHKFISCDGKKTVITQLKTSSIKPILGNVYNMSFCVEKGEFTHVEFENTEFTQEEVHDCECYTYLGYTDEERTHELLSIYNDYHSDICDVCLGCIRLRSCDIDKCIIVNLSDESGFNNSDLGKIVFLEGNTEIEDRGFRFMGYERCDLQLDYENLKISDKIDCTNCNSLNPYYKCTNCIDKEDTFYMWTKRGFNLDESKSYVFKFNPDSCYTVQSLPMNCSDVREDEYVITKEDIKEVYDSCDNCTEQSIIIKDCLTDTLIKPLNQEQFSSYVGKYVKYDTGKELRCGYVSSVRTGRYEVIELDVEQKYGCYSDCDTCMEKVETLVDEEIETQREVQPNLKEKVWCPEKKEKCCKPKPRCYGPNRIL